MSTTKVQLDIAGGIATIVLDDPDNKNALGSSIVAGIMAALDTIEADDSARVVVLTNTGNTFCAGANLKDRSAPDGEESDGGTMSDPFTNVLSRLQDFAKPVVGKIDGHAVGGGMGLVAACDISVGVEDNRFGFTEVRLGVAPAMISVVCLPKMRESEAREAFLRGNRFNGTRCAELGILNHAVPAEALDATVDEIVQDLLAGGPAALTACKQILATVTEMDREQAYAVMAELSNSLFVGSEAQAGMKAFLAREPAPWIAADSS